MANFLPHTSVEIQHMLSCIGVDSIEDLFSDIPKGISLNKAMDIPPALAESDVLAKIQNLAEKNRVMTLFAGSGQYDHVIPSAIKYLAGRSEFVTSYTPYQPEISQGMLQALFEFQSAIAEITGLPVSNASLYDGFTAAAEACAMALGSRKKSRIILLADTVHSYTKQVLSTHFSDLNVEIRLLEESQGRILFDSLETAIEKAGNELAGVLVQTPNIYGALENLEGWSDAIHTAGGRLIISSHPLALGCLASPAQWGADIAIGDTQALGLPMYFGGPSAGYISCTKNLVRKMPGRIVGESVDVDGKRAFVLTLQAREQHIKRMRATSNICTNQSLAALMNLIYLALLGPEGFKEVSKRNINAAESLRETLVESLKLKDYSPGPIFNEFTLRIPVPRGQWDAAFESSNYLSGVWMSDLDPQYPKDLLTIAVTEKRTADELRKYENCAREALK